MWDQLASRLGDLSTFIPWVSFLAGLGGGLHCVGMCGGLVAASCDRPQEIVRYQIGRLLGYLLLGALAGVLGSLLNIQAIPQLSLISGVLIGLVFIYWGAQNFRGRRAELPVPKFLGQLYTRLWRGLVQRNRHLTRAFFTGFISILLPCGLLYGVVLGTVALQNTGTALLSMFFFWLGTVPSMVAAPGAIQRFLKPLKLKLPKTYAVSLMMIGVLTITFRLSRLHGSAAEVKSTAAPIVRHCH